MQMSDPTEAPLSTSLSPLLDDSSADVTTQLAASERTADELDAFTPQAADAGGTRVGDGVARAEGAGDVTGEIEALAEGVADATGEIEALDILEVVEVLRTSRIAVAPVSEPVSLAPHAPPHSRAAEVLETSRLPAVMIARPSVPIVPVPIVPVPSVPVALASMPHAPGGYDPSSIAPLALDVTSPARGSYASDPSYGSATHAAWRTPMPPDLRESTLQIARAAGIPSRASRIVVFTASVAGMCLVAGILGVMLGYSHAPARSAQPMSLAAPGPVAGGGGAMAAGGPRAAGGGGAIAAGGPGAAGAVAAGAAAPAPRVAVVTGAREEITEGPILVPAKDAASIADPLDELAVKPAPMATPVVAAPAPAAAPAAAQRNVSAAPAAPVARAMASPGARSSSSSASSSSSTNNSGTGVLRLPASVSGVLIDGVPHKAGGGGLVVSCGRHTVKAPGHPSRLVIVPCGGSAAL